MSYNRKPHRFVENRFAIHFSHFHCLRHFFQSSKKIRTILKNDRLNAFTQFDFLPTTHLLIKFMTRSNPLIEIMLKNTKINIKNIHCCNTSSYFLCFLQNHKL